MGHHVAVPWPFFRKRPGPDTTLVADVIERNVVIAHRLDEADREHLTHLTIDLIGGARWESVGGFEITEEVQVTIAANAAIPILHLDPWLYREVHSIIVLPTTSVAVGERAGPADGTVSDDPMAIIGEAAPHSGPVSISWDAAVRESRRPRRGRNVVIHEFAHKIDMTDGYADGAPPMGRGPHEQWMTVVADEFERPDARPSDEVLDPYAWSHPAEFFAVSTEAFFCVPEELAHAKPDLYRALAGFYRQDPAAS